ncbi:hypothetical protein F5144DRAFT_2499 [Chaetomium tenue]|uniref:Uncharacterized protein n=1 Tax=Chaetomium tenue TaxID=1854479 RepID=A0ACB7PK93_9PEZI|nr:hypothetical protein F5144DRAFT_2499 [Chaetomium globosum]
MPTCAVSCFFLLLYQLRGGVRASNGERDGPLELEQHYADTIKTNIRISNPARPLYNPAAGIQPLAEIGSETTQGWGPYNHARILQPGAQGEQGDFVYDQLRPARSRNLPV